MKKEELSKEKIIWAVIIVFVLAYFFVYKPYFTENGKFERETKDIRNYEQKVVYYACGLPEDHKFHRMLAKECNELEEYSDDPKQNW